MTRYRPIALVLPVLLAPVGCGTDHDTPSATVSPSTESDGAPAATPTDAGTTTSANDAGTAALRPCDNGDALPVTLEAEDLLLTGLVAKKDAAASGGGAVDAFARPDQSVGLTVCAPTDGYYTLTFRYGNGSVTTATRTLTIDGVTVPGSVPFIARADAARWEPVAPSAAPRKSVRLTAGRHDLALVYGDADRGVVALDAMTLSAGPAPSNTSVTSLLMNNWGSLVAMHHAGRTFPQATGLFGPRLGGLHWKGDWPTNQIEAATGFLRDDTTGKPYSDFSRNPFQSHQSLGVDGVATADYLSWGEVPLPAAVKKEYALVPNEDFLLVRYTLENVTSADHAFSLLEHVHPHNKLGTTGAMKASYRADLSAWVFDLSDTNGTFVIAGALQAPASHGAGAVGDNSLVAQFETSGALDGAAATSGADIEAGFVAQAALPPGATQELDYYYAVAADLAGVEAIAARVRSKSVAAWFRAQSDAWAGWLATGTPLASTDATLLSAYAHSLVSIRQAQQPEYGSFVAATNPTYLFKVWPRDSAAVALGLDGAGFLDDAERFWLWMARAQEKGTTANFPRGTWYTNYDFWQPTTGIGFVSPEWDSLGLFLVGVYQHHRLLAAKDPARASAFLAKVAPAFIDAATFIETSVNPDAPTDHGFGPKDFSIWEDKFEWAGFTQVTYASGLLAAHALAPAAGLAVPTRAVGWLAAARLIKDALTRPYDAATCSGTWDEAEQYLYRGINPDCTPDLRTDASVNLIAVLGLIAADDPKAVGLRARTIAQLQPQKAFNTEGIARFDADEFYYSSIYSPGGINESTVPMPVWPQMSMYVAMSEHWTGDDAAALARLQWVVSVMGQGFMAPGEAVDWSTQQLMVSTAIEPVTASWFVLGLLTYLDQYDTRLPLDEGV